MSEPVLRVVQVSSIFDETPEGQFRMDRLRRAEEQRRAALAPWEREFEDRIAAAETAAFVFGTKEENDGRDATADSG